MLPRGNFTLYWLDEKGIRHPRPVSCLRNEPLTIPLPISSLGQLLGLGVPRWPPKRIDQAEKILNDVAKRAPKFRPRISNAQQQALAEQRAQVVLARSEYFLGKVQQAKNLPALAHDNFVKYLAYASRPGAIAQDDITPDAQTQLKLLESQLGRFVVSLKVGDKCQTFTTWNRPGTVNVDVDIGKGQPPRMFKNKRLWAGKPTHDPQDDECKP
jgi:hypothetical protein